MLWGLVIFAVTLVTTACSSGDSSATGNADGATQTACGSKATCELCLACAQSSACKSKGDACTTSADCNAFRTCIGEKDDPATVATCRSQQPTGAIEYCDYTACVVYEQCGALCEPSVACPR
jgi:hypothetical protein